MAPGRLRTAVGLTDQTQPQAGETPGPRRREGAGLAGRAERRARCRASLTNHAADEPVRPGASGGGAERVEVQPGALADGAEHGRRRVGRALEQPLQEPVHQEHGRPQAALVTASLARLPDGRGRRGPERRLGRGTLLPLPMLAALLAVSVFPVSVLSLGKKRVHGRQGLWRRSSGEQRAGREHRLR